MSFAVSDAVYVATHFMTLDLDANEVQSQAFDELFQIEQSPSLVGKKIGDDLFNQTWVRQNIDIA